MSHVSNPPLLLATELFVYDAISYLQARHSVPRLTIKETPNLTCLDLTKTTKWTEGTSTSLCSDIATTDSCATLKSTDRKGRSPEAGCRPSLAAPVACRRASLGARRGTRYGRTAPASSMLHSQCSRSVTRRRTSHASGACRGPDMQTETAQGQRSGNAVEDGA